MRVRLAAGPVSWGVDFADGPDNPPWPEVLGGIAAAGFRWTELGPVGYLPEDTETLAGELAERGLAVAGSFVFQPLHAPDRAPEVLEVTRRTCRLIAGVGGRSLVIIDMPSAARVATAGRSGDAPRLPAAAWRALTDTIRRVADVAGAEFGLRSVVHPHAGGYLEFEDEIACLLDAIGPDTAQLCLDTGHAAYAGHDPVALYRRFAERIRYLHLKDVDPAVRRRVQAGELDFWQAIAAGVFCPVGRGAVDFVSFAEALRAGGFEGPATVEQDRDPGHDDDPVGDLVESRCFLERAGLALAAVKAGE
jgi:inosose dehydratase